MVESKLMNAIATVRPGPWAVAVSGGADSVALLRLLLQRTDLSLHVVHLDHETREGESTVDAEFVRSLAAELKLPATIMCRREIEPLLQELPRNISARYRAIRMVLFAEVVNDHRLQGVVLAHHANDQAETVLHRLHRGSGAAGLAGMSARSTLANVTLLRPLLEVAPEDLRQFLRSLPQPWREDSSNASPKYLRNRLRPIVAGDAGLRESLLNLAKKAAEYRRSLDAASTVLPDHFSMETLADLPPPLARHAAARWLIVHGSPPDEISREVCDRLIAMSADAASPYRQDFPGRISVCRKRGTISVPGKMQLTQKQFKPPA